MITEKNRIENRSVPGPGLVEFLKGSGSFPAFHFYELMKDYGDMVRCGPYFYLINHPDLAKDILNRDQKDFSQQDFIGRRVKTVFGHGMVTSSGKLWSSQRRLLNPIFSHKNLHRTMTEVISEIDACLNEWPMSKHADDSYDLADLMGTLTIQVAGSQLFQTDFSKHVEKFKAIVKSGTAYIAEGLPFYMPFWIPKPSHLKLKMIGRDIDAILNEIIDEIKNKNLESDNMASAMIKEHELTNTSEHYRRVMLDEMKTMLAGGYFPVSCSLSMIWYTLGQHPEYLNMMKDEIRNLPDDYSYTQNFYNDFPNTMACIFEAMRLYPVAFSIWRKARVDFETGGYVIPKGKSICISLFNIHRNPKFWQNPDAFIPERFMGTASKDRPKHHFMPFGWGNRKCIGDHYAMMVIFLTIIRTLKRFDLKIIHESLKVRRAALICPKRVMGIISPINN